LIDTYSPGENVCTPKACLVIFVRTGAIFECPPGVFRAARLVNEMPDGVVLVLPEPANPAGLAVLTPKLDVDVSVLNLRKGFNGVAERWPWA
jgi:hypothetical protein